MRSRGLFSLLMADHIPPSFSPWLISWAFRVSHFCLACRFSRWVISFARIASFQCVTLLLSRSRLSVSVFQSFLRLLMHVVILWYDSCVCFFTIFLMLSLNAFQRC